MRERKETNERKEIVIITITVADAFGDFDFVVETLQLAGADLESGMSS